MIEDKFIAEIIGDRLAQHAEHKYDAAFEALQDVEIANDAIINARLLLDKLTVSTGTATSILITSKEARTEAMKKYLQLINE